MHEVPERRPWVCPPRRDDDQGLVQRSHWAGHQEPGRDQEPHRPRELQDHDQDFRGNFKFGFCAQNF